MLPNKRAHSITSQSWSSAWVVGASLAVILLVASYFRFTGLYWDEGQWIHPDEGHMRIITSAIKIPPNLSLYFDTHNSPLNARNSGQQYSYGTLPLFLTRWTAEWLDKSCTADANRLSAAVGPLFMGGADESCYPGTFTGPRSAQVGRSLSALADVGSVLLIFLIGRLLYGDAVGLLAAGLGTLTAFTIQQAHFFTVDSMANFFILLTALFSVHAVLPAIRSGRSHPTESAMKMTRPSWVHFGLAGLATGLATACKVSAIVAALFVVLAAGWWWLETLRISGSRSAVTAALRLLPYLALSGLLSLVAFRIAQPYAFEGPGFFGLKPSPEWFERLGQIRREQAGEIDLPSGRQWTNRAPILFPWVNMVVWGLGLPLGVAVWASWAVVGIELLRGKLQHLVLWGWASAVFFYEATRWVKAMRYLLPLYPIFVILAACVLVRLCTASSSRVRRAGYGITTLVVAGAAIWAIAVFSIYVRPNTRVAASRWILANVPTGVTVANEHWDWGVPLRVDGTDPFGNMYHGLEMAHYDEDTVEKQSQLFDWLEKADYIFLASNRLYASISRLPTRYPLTTAYYRALFAGELGFELAADFTSRPSVGPFQFPDQEMPYPLMEPAQVHQREPIKVWLTPAEEAFSVYDHPRVLIFRKTPAFSQQRLKEVLDQIDLEQVEIGLSPQQATTVPQISGVVFWLGLVVMVILVGGSLAYGVVRRQPSDHYRKDQALGSEWQEQEMRT